MDDRIFSECLISSASNHTKLVRRENNPYKKAFMYIPYVSCNYKLSGMLTCKFERVLKWGCDPLTDWMHRLWVE